MTFDEAKRFQIQFGKHTDYGRTPKTMDEIAKSDEGLKWLDWLRGEREEGVSKGKRVTALDEALRTYLDDPAIRKELNNDTN